MNAEQQRVAIAEARGWTFEFKPAHGCMVLTISKDGCGTSTGKADQVEALMELVKVPNYSEDLNAMHEAEEPLHANYDRQQVYIINLRKVVYRTKHSGQSIDFAMVNASATQRAEAFLKTLHLWKD